MLQEAAHFAHHVLLFQTVTQALADAVAPQVAVYADAHDVAVQAGEVALQRAVLAVIGLYLDGADGTLRRVEVRDVVQRLVALEYRLELGQGAVLQFLSQGGVLRHSLHLVAPEDGLDVEPRATTKNRPTMTSEDVIVGLVEVFLEAEEVVLLSRFADVDEMEGNGNPFHCVVGQVFTRADVHAAIHLPAVCTDDLRVAQTGGKVGSKCRLARGSGTEDGDERHRREGGITQLRRPRRTSCCPPLSGPRRWGRHYR